MIKINKAVAIKQRAHYVRKQLTPFVVVVVVIVVVVVGVVLTEKGTHILDESVVKRIKVELVSLHFNVLLGWLLHTA